MKIADFIKALKAGEEIKNPATWKNRQTTTNAIAAIIGVGVAIAKWKGVGLHMSDTDLMTLAGGGAAVLGLANGVMTTISSKKVGMKNASTDIQRDPTA